MALDSGGAVLAMCRARAVEGRRVEYRSLSDGRSGCIWGVNVRGDGGGQLPPPSRRGKRASAIPLARDSEGRPTPGRLALIKHIMRSGGRHTGVKTSRRGAVPLLPGLSPLHFLRGAQLRVHLDGRRHPHAGDRRLAPGGGAPLAPPALGGCGDTPGGLGGRRPPPRGAGDRRLPGQCAARHVLSSIRGAVDANCRRRGASGAKWVGGGALPRTGGRVGPGAPVKGGCGVPRRVGRPPRR